MIDHSKRQTLTLLSASVIVSAVPSGLVSASDSQPSDTKNKHEAYDGELHLPEVKFTVSTLGANSAITTITNNSRAVVTVTRLTPALVQHNGKNYDVNAAFGSKGVSLKPGQKRMLIARELAPLMA